MPRSKESPNSGSKPTKQPPRPPNAWILFRADMSKSMPPARPGEPRPAQSAVSKAISKMWAEAPPEVKAAYERRADDAKLEHMIKFPEYKFAPVKKEDKIRLREEKRREKESQREQTRKSRTRPAPYTPIFPSNNPSPAYYPPENLYGSLGPSPPISAASSPADSGPFAEFGASLQPDSLSPDSSSSSNTTTSPLTLPSWSLAPSAATSPAPSIWQDSQSQSSQAIDTVAFNIEMLPNQSWESTTSEFDDHIHGFLSHTDDPSIFNLTFDPQALVTHPQGELNVSFGNIDVPDFSNFDFSALWNAPTQNVDTVSPDASLPVDLASFLPPQNDTTYNADDYINYDATSPETTQVASPSSPPMTHTPPTSSKYVPPAGASRAPLRRAAGYWPQPFTTSDANMDPSPPRYSVPAT